MDDDFVEETEYVTVKLTTSYNNVLYDIDETIVTIEDNDCKCIIYAFYLSDIFNIDIHIGFKQELMKSSTTLNKGIINLEIVHYRGILQPGLTVSLTLQLEGPQGISINVLI